MLPLCLTLLVLLATAPGAEDPGALISEATEAYRDGNYARSARLFEAAVEAGADTPSAAYNAAYCHARLGQTEAAFAWLDRALDAGWRDVAQLKADAGFGALYADPRWGLAVHRCQKAFDKFSKLPKEPALREELLRRMTEDQRIRMTPNPDMHEWLKIDADNTAFMKTVIEKHGWPGRSMVGDDGALAAFLMVQHADADRGFQQQCLEWLTKAVEQREARAADMAYLTDRVLVGDDKAQRYGTQFHTADGELKPLPIEDEPNVDARRKQVGLPPLAEYAQQIRDMERARNP